MNWFIKRLICYPIVAFFLLASVACIDSLIQKFNFTDVFFLIGFIFIIWGTLKLPDYNWGEYIKKFLEKRSLRTYVSLNEYKENAISSKVYWLIVVSAAILAAFMLVLGFINIQRGGNFLVTLLTCLVVNLLFPFIISPRYEVAAFLKKVGLVK